MASKQEFVGAILELPAPLNGYPQAVDVRSKGIKTYF
jgi:hypothetical protein